MQDFCCISHLTSCSCYYFAPMADRMTIDGAGRVPLRENLLKLLPRHNISATFAMGCRLPAAVCVASRAHCLCACWLILPASVHLCCSCRPLPSRALLYYIERSDEFLRAFRRASAGRSALAAGCSCPFCPQVWRACFGRSIPSCFVHMKSEPSHLC